VAISVGDAVLKITGDSTSLDKELKAVDGKVKGMSDSMAKNMRIAGAAITAAGATVTAAIMLSMKAAAEEDVGIIRLSVAMNNVGLAYDGATGSLEKWIDSMQQSTAFADDEMREALSGLIILTGDMTKAQDLLTLSMDLARWKNIDLGTASDIVTKVYAGNSGILSRYGIIVKEGATATEALAEIQKAAAGQAEAYGKSTAGQMELLKNNIGDVSEAIGGALIPVVSDLLKNVMPIIQSIKAWIAEHPGLTKVIVIAAAAIGGLMLVLGPLLMILPGLIAALPLLGVAFTIATGPVGIIIAAIAALIAIGILLAKNWDKIREFFVGSIDAIKNAMIAPFRAAAQGIESAINWIISMINKISFDIPSWVPGLGGKHFGFNIAPFTLPSFKGFEGIIPGIPGTPMLATVHAGEYIGQGQGNTVNIYNPVVRNDNDIRELTRQVSREMYRMQQVRYG